MPFLRDKNNEINKIFISVKYLKLQLQLLNRQNLRYMYYRDNGILFSINDNKKSSLLMTLITETNINT